MEILVDNKHTMIVEDLFHVNDKYVATDLSIEQFTRKLINNQSDISSLKLSFEDFATDASYSLFKNNIEYIVIDDEEFLKQTKSYQKNFFDSNVKLTKENYIKGHPAIMSSIFNIIKYDLNYVLKSTLLCEIIKKAGIKEATSIIEEPRLNKLKLNTLKSRDFDQDFLKCAFYFMIECQTQYECHNIKKEDIFIPIEKELSAFKDFLYHYGSEVVKENVCWNIERFLDDFNFEIKCSWEE